MKRSKTRFMKPFYPPASANEEMSVYSTAEQQDLRPAARRHLREVRSGGLQTNTRHFLASFEPASLGCAPFLYGEAVERCPRCGSGVGFAAQHFGVQLAPVGHSFESTRLHFGGLAAPGCCGVAKNRPDS